MVTCPVCDGDIDVDEEEVDEGDTLSCDECGASLKVLGKDPLELESADEADEDEDEDDLDDEEEDADEDAEEEDEDDEDDDWK
jgi:alpha-aminoadipate carrier protein LysW